MAHPAQPSTPFQIFAKSTSALNDNEKLVMISVQPSEGTGRTPTDLVCIVDVSGSMNDTVTSQNEKGDVESHGLTILDVVKHAMRTVVATMGPLDRLSLITFSSSVTNVFSLTPMDIQGKSTAETAISNLHPGGRTNLWGGLHAGLEALRSSSREGRLAAAMLLTDGQPNVEPPGGHVACLQEYLQRFGCSGPLSTFGFGYNLNSRLLAQLAEEGSGTFSFIPDGGFIGTVFVHAISNILVTATRPAYLALAPRPDVQIIEVLGNHGGVNYGRIPLGGLQYGQPRQVCVRLSSGSDSTEPLLKALVSVQFQEGAAQSYTAFTMEASPEEALEIEVHRLRLLLVSHLRKMLDGVTAAQRAVAEVITCFSQSSAVQDPRTKSFMEDIRGQMTEASSRGEWYTRWGVHYLPALMHAHWMQRCPNFKDPGVQRYGGVLFRGIRDAAEDQFITLPPPTPSRAPVSRGPAVPVDMRSYYNASGGCFGGNCTITLADGSLTAVKLLKKGDAVKTPCGTALVQCVVEKPCLAGETQLIVFPDGLQITPFHPILFNGTWVFPSDICKLSTVFCPAVYNLALDNHHIVSVNGIECVTLGHGFEEDVVRHQFFGTSKVIEHLSTLDGWEKGHVLLHELSEVRDCSGLVVALRSLGVAA